VFLLGQGGRVASFSVPWGPTQGTVPAGLSGGGDSGEGDEDDDDPRIDATLLEAVFAVGEPMPDGGIVGVGPRSIEVLLPAGFPAGRAHAVLYVVYGDGLVLSNTVSVELGAGGAP
jgi:hypothetical protein